jgi:hypothetical protein
MHDKFRIGFKPTELEVFFISILTGEDMPSEFKKIHWVVTELIAEFTDHFCDSADPFWGCEWNCA